MTAAKRKRSKGQAGTASKTGTATGQAGSREPLGVPLDSKRHWVLWAVLVVGVFAAYSPTLTNDFVYDDKDLILNNPLVRDQRWGEIWQTDLWSATPRPASTYYRPLVATSFALEHSLYGENPAGYHADNLLLHCIAIVLLFLVARDVVGRRRYGIESVVLATFIFAFHPANTQIVYWVSARGDLFVTIAILVGMYCVRRSGPLAAVGLVLSAALALFSKETGLLYFLLVPLHAFLFAPDKRPIRYIGLRMAMLAPVALVYLALRAQAVPFSLGMQTEESFWTSADGLHTRLLTVPTIWGYYLLRACFPFFLNFETGIHLYDSPLDWQFLAGTAAVALSVVAAIRFRRHELFRWAGLFWLVSLLPFLNIFFATFESGMEHYLYLPLTAFAVFVGAVVPKRRATAVAGAALIAAFAVTIFMRGAVWSDDVSLWSDAAAKTDPKCRQGWNRAMGNLAHTYQELADQNVDREANLTKAGLLYGEIVERHPDYGYAWKGLGDVAFARRDLDRAETCYRRAVEQRPHDYTFRNKLGVVLVAQGRYAEAREQYEQTLDLNPGYPAAVLNLAMIHMRLGDYDAARRTIATMSDVDFARYPNSRAIEIAIDVATGQTLTASAADVAAAAVTLDEMGLYADEARVLELLHRSGRIDGDALYRLAMVHLVRLNNADAGVGYLEEGFARYPNDDRFPRALLTVYDQLGDAEKAAALRERLQGGGTRQR